MRAGTAEEEGRECCAPRRTLALFATKWTSMILHTLHVRHDGPVRTGVLLRSIPGILKKMLTQTLREMEAAGLVARQVHGTVPPAVDYALTPPGERFVAPAQLLYEWDHRDADALDALHAKPACSR